MHCRAQRPEIDLFGEAVVLGRKGMNYVHHDLRKNYQVLETETWSNEEKTKLIAFFGTCIF